MSLIPLFALTVAVRSHTRCHTGTGAGVLRIGGMGSNTVSYIFQSGKCKTPFMLCLLIMFCEYQSDRFDIVDILDSEP